MHHIFAYTWIYLLTLVFSDCRVLVPSSTMCNAASCPTNDALHCLYRPASGTVAATCTCPPPPPPPSELLHRHGCFSLPPHSLKTVDVQSKAVSCLNSKETMQQKK